MNTQMIKMLQCILQMVLQGNLAKIAACGPVLTDHYREVAALQRDSNALVLSGAREVGCYRKVAAVHSDHLRQVPLYLFCTGLE